MPQSLRLPDGRISILLITADNITAELLKSGLTHERTKDFAVETSIGSSQMIIDRLAAFKPHVALISETLQDGSRSGFKVLQKLRDSHPRTATIMLSCSDPDCVFRRDCVVGAFCEGARGIVSPTHSLKALSKCIRMVHQGQYWASNEDFGNTMSALAHLKSPHFNDANGMPLLTHREEDVVRLVSDGLKNGEIAQRLNVAEHSIRNYLYRIFDKLGVSTRTELILYAFHWRDRGN